jgi:hypothetical protein
MSDETTTPIVTEEVVTPVVEATPEVVEATPAVEEVPAAEAPVAEVTV